MRVMSLKIRQMTQVHHQSEEPRHTSSPEIQAHQQPRDLATPAAQETRHTTSPGTQMEADAYQAADAGAKL